MHEDGASLDSRATFSPRAQLPRLLGLLGGALLAASVATPLIHVPIVGNISYLHHPQARGYEGASVILAAAAATIILAVIRWFKLLWVTALVSLAQLAATLLAFHRTAAAVVAQADQAKLVDPALMWAGAAFSRAHYAWGIAVVAAGAFLLLVAGAWTMRSPTDRTLR